MQKHDAGKKLPTATPSTKGLLQESHSQCLTNMLLDERNFLPWSRAVTVALGGCSKLGHINGKIEAHPEDDLGYEEWLASDNSVMSWIFNSVEPYIYEIFAYSNSAQALWDALVGMYGQFRNASRIFEIHRELANSRQGENQSFTLHLGNFKRKWDKLQ